MRSESIENTEFATQYEQSERVKQIRRFNPESCVDDKKDINILRNRMFYEAEQTLLENKDANVAFAERRPGREVESGNELQSEIIGQKYQ